jgi:hypothetical protein
MKEKRREEKGRFGKGVWVPDHGSMANWVRGSGAADVHWDWDGRKRQGGWLGNTRHLHWAPPQHDQHHLR